MHYFTQNTSKIFWGWGTAPSPDPIPAGEGYTLGGLSPPTVKILATSVGEERRVNPVAFFESRHHDDGAGPLFPDHAPEVGERLRQRSLRGDVGARATVAVDVVGVDVVASRHTAATGATYRIQPSDDDAVSSFVMVPYTTDVFPP